jgi:hypothetical protein
MAANGFRSAFNKDNLISSATVSTVAGTYVKLGEYKVLAGESIAIGYGSQDGQESAQGRVSMQFKDAAALVPGTVRLSIMSAQDAPLEILGEFRTESLDTGTTNRGLMIPLPEHPAIATQDKKIVLEIKADAAQTLTKANCTILMDITRYRA